MASTSTSDHKRMRLDTPGASTTNTHFTLRILQNRAADKIIELSDDGYTHKPTAKVKINDMVDEVYFQDNTLAFKTLLSLEDLVIIIYPPGSGKTTFALLLESFLSSNITWSTKLSTFFKNCEFSKLCKEDFEKFQHSGKVAYINFEDIEGTNRAEFEKSLGRIMLSAFKKYFPENIWRDEIATLKEERGNVYGTLLGFCTELRATDKTKSNFLLLDSCDTVYNTIAQLGPEAVHVCKRFTKFLKSAVPTGSSGITLICFGVSPYFAHEFSGKAHIHDISRKENELGRYFSYSAETINKVIEKWELKTSYDECLKVAQFKYNDRIFINPAVCVSFLQSLHCKEEYFQVDIMPRSLWLSSIFTLEDRDLLLDILCGPCEKEFSIGVSIMSLISREPTRKLFYPLFIFGGFISCIPRNDPRKYELSIANETSRCVMEKSLNDIYVAVYKHGFKECSEIYEMIFMNKWQELCNSMSEMLSFMSTKTFNQEKDYNNWLFGLFCPAKLRGFSVNRVTLRNNISLAGIFPDLTLTGTSRLAAVWELKYLKATVVRKKFAEGLTLSECYGKCNVNDAHKRTVLNEIKQEFLAAKPQITQYASSYVTTEECSLVKCFIPILYLNHVALFVNDYDPNIPSTTWTAYCSDGFFTQVNLTNLMEE